MPLGKGYKAWGSIIHESTYGTDPGGARKGYFRVVPPESIKVDKSYYQSPGSGTRAVRGMHEGVFVCRGDISPETNFEGGWLSFPRNALGGYTFTSGAPVVGTNTHTFFTVDDLVFSDSMELSRGDIGANNVFLYLGLMVDKIAWKLEQDSLLGCTCSIIAQNEVPDTARIAAPTYPAELPIKNVYYNPSYAAASAVAVGSNVTTLQSATITLDNKLELRPNLAKYTAQPQPGDQREVLVNLVADFEDTVHYNKFLAETEGNFSLYLAGPIITGSTRYTVKFELGSGGTSHMIGSTPPIDSLGKMQMPIDLRLIKGIEFQFSVINNQATVT